jgi:cell division protein FtsZ
MNPESTAAQTAAGLPVRVKVFGVGSAGVAMLGAIDFTGANFAAVDTDPVALAAFTGSEKILLETKMLRGLGTGGDPERGREVAEAHFAQLKSSCAGAEVVFLFAGLGGGAGTGMTPVLARAAKEAGALVLAFVALPFDCEGSRRHQQARGGLDQLKTSADGVICLPCQKVAALIDPNLSLLDTFKTTTEILLDGARGVWRLLTHRGLIPLHFADLCAVLAAVGTDEPQARLPLVVHLVDPSARIDDLAAVGRNLWI